MRKTSKRRLIIALGLTSLLAIPGIIWLSLTHQPKFLAAKSQLTRFQNASTYFGRALR